MSTLPSPIPELQHAPLPLKVLRARERALTSPPSAVLYLDSLLNPSRSWESIQFIIWTTNLSWFFVKGFQIVKHTSEIVMFLHCCKYWRPKMWGKLVCVSTSCPFFNHLEPFALSMFSFFISFFEIKVTCNCFRGLLINCLHGLGIVSIS